MRRSFLSQTMLISVIFVVFPKPASSDIFADGDLAFHGRDIRGITLAPIEDGMLGDVGYGSPPCEEAIAQIIEVGATWISITPFGRMDDLDSTEVIPYFEVFEETSDERMRKTAMAAHDMGLRVAIIPHVYIMSGRWRGEIDPGNDASWEQWFSSYGSFVKHHAALAEELNADLFSIGVEFKSSTNFRADRWVTLIDEIREIYSGLLTYSANWDEVDTVPFWDLLDLIGINAFWPLADNPGDGYEQMLARSGRIATLLEALYFDTGRHIIFTEMGFKSAVDSALAPWEWPEHSSDLIYDELYQAEAYEAFLDEMLSHPWFEGFFIWKYFSDPYDETQESAEGFSPKGKLAELVLSEYFSLPYFR